MAGREEDSAVSDLELSIGGHFDDDDDSSSGKMLVDLQHLRDQLLKEQRKVHSLAKLKHVVDRKNQILNQKNRILGQENQTLKKEKQQERSRTLALERKLGALEEK